MCSEQSILLVKTEIQVEVEDAMKGKRKDRAATSYISVVIVIVVITIVHPGRAIIRVRPVGGRRRTTTGTRPRCLVRFRWGDGARSHLRILPVEQLARDYIGNTDSHLRDRFLLRV